MKNMDIEDEAGQMITNLFKNKQNIEASMLGDLLGNYRRGHIGDSMLKHGIESAKNALDELAKIK